MEIKGKLYLDILDHYQENENREVCGVIYEGEYIRIANVCETEILRDDDGNPILDESGNEQPKSLDNFEFSEADAAEWVYSKKAEALVHTHVNGKLYPSLRDQQNQVATGIPWVIMGRTANGTIDHFVWGEKTALELPLYGRPFRHAVTDCYEAIRAYYWQVLHIYLEPAPRHNDWWDLPDDLYMENYKKWGFREVDLNTETPLKDDVFMVKLGTTKYNHAGVLLHDNRGYHHRAGRLSGDTGIGHYRNAGLKFYRYIK